MDTNFTNKCSEHVIHLQRDNSIEAEIFVSESGHVSSFLLKRYWLKICIQYTFLNRSIENRDPLHWRSAPRKTKSISDIVIQRFLITRSISLKKELNSASYKKKTYKIKVYMESKTVMLLNSVLMTTLIFLYVKI